MANPNWKKGISGNPKGRPPLPHKKELIERLQDAGAIDKAVQVMIEGLSNGKIKYDSAKFIIEQVYGKAMQRNELTGEDGRELTVNFILPEGTNVKS